MNSKTALKLSFDLTILAIAVVFNSIAIDGVLHSSITLIGYRRFLIGILVSDIYICIVKAVFFIRQIITISTHVNSSLIKCFYNMERTMEMIGFIAFILNLTAMFIDNFVSLVFPIRYRKIMNNAVVKNMVFILWGVAILIGVADHPIGITISYLTTPDPAKLSLTKQASKNCTFGVKYTGDDDDDDCDPKEFASIVKKYMDFIQGGGSSAELDLGDDTTYNWCSHSTGNSHIVLDCIVISLSIATVIFMAICNAIFSRQIKKLTGNAAGHTKRKMGKLIATTLLLLFSFSIWSVH